MSKDPQQWTPITDMKQSDLNRIVKSAELESTKKSSSARDEVVERFAAYRRPTEQTIPKFKAIQEKAQELALLIFELCPDSKQKATALTQLEMCKMSANAAVAIHTPPPEAVQV